MGRRTTLLVPPESRLIVGDIIYDPNANTVIR